MDLLPEELLVDILQRLPPRPLAVCCSVSKDLCATIDGWDLLLALAHHVPRGLHGVNINFVGQNSPYFFSRTECAAPRIDAELSFVPEYGWTEVAHICNGLVLLEKNWINTLHVCNPATQRWAQLPPRPKGFHSAGEHLVFDPTVSLHYDVISFSEVPPTPKMPINPSIKRSPRYGRARDDDEYYAEEIENLPSYLRAKYDHEGSAEWPPSSYVAQVFSSRTARWEERTYVREDDVAVTLSDIWSYPWGRYSGTLTYFVPRTNAVYWQGAFYIHCRGGFVMRLSMLEQKYQVIKTPRLDDVFTKPTDDFFRGAAPYRNREYLREFQEEHELLDIRKASVHLGKSKNGIYYTALSRHQLRVWVLHETSEPRPIPEWVLKHKADITPSFLRHYMRKNRDEIETSWGLDLGKNCSNDGVDSGWDSSDDDVINNVDGEDGNNNGGGYRDMSDGMNLLGYHPCKEIAFLGDRFEGFAYYLGSCKLQYLGRFYPVGCNHSLVAATHESFIYTPCMDDLLPDNKNDTTHDGLEDEEEDTGEDEDLEEEEEEEEEDTDEDEDQDEEVEETDEDKDLEESDEDYIGSEEDRDNDEDEDGSICHLSRLFL